MFRLSSLGAAACLAATMAVADASAGTITFDDLAPGAPAATLVAGAAGTLALSLNSAFGLVVGTGLETTSGANYLAVDDGGTGLFLAGDVLTLSFSSPISRLTLTAVATRASVGADTLTLAGGGAATSSGATPDGVLASGDEVFILTLLAPAPFTTATFSIGDGLASLHLDDITFDVVPAPGAAILFASGVILIGARRRKAGA